MQAEPRRRRMPRHPRAAPDLGRGATPFYGLTRVVLLSIAAAAPAASTLPNIASTDSSGGQLSILRLQSAVTGARPRKNANASKARMTCAGVQVDRSAGAGSARAGRAASRRPQRRQVSSVRRGREQLHARARAGAAWGNIGTGSGGARFASSGSADRPIDRRSRRDTSAEDTGLMTSDRLPQPIRGHDGATILGPRNPAIERANPDLLAPPRTDSRTVPNLKYSFAAAHNPLLPAGWAREVTTRELPIATELAGVNMRLEPGGVRELHWHKEAEWAYMLAGRARITAVDQEGRNFIDDVGVGDLWNFPAGIPHSIQGLDEGCEFLLVFDEGNFSENETFLITDWFKHTDRRVLAKNFGVPESAFADIPIDIEHDRYIFPAPPPGPLVSDAVAAPAGSSERFSYRLPA